MRWAGTAGTRRHLCRRALVCLLLALFGLEFAGPLLASVSPQGTGSAMACCRKAGRVGCCCRRSNASNTPGWASAPSCLSRCPSATPASPTGGDAGLAPNGLAPAAWLARTGLAPGYRTNVAPEPPSYALRQRPPPAWPSPQFWCLTAGPSAC